MKASNELWKERLTGKVPTQLAEEIDVFETEIDLRSQDKVDEKVFAETRLRRGVYGQRYDNGQRHDGTESKTLAFEEKVSKGPNTVWDAPGMLRIKIPYGGMTTAQLELMADLTEEYSDGIAHITTRQDFQLHYIHLENTPAIMRRLGEVGITTREACGNSVRNVTGCPFMGVCKDEPFDVTPYADALMKFLLGHQDAQNFGRKFKPSFSGCSEHSCGLSQMHDFGLIARVKEVDGQEVRGFKVVVGGGLGAVPRQAKTFDEFLAPEDLLPLAQAIARIFGRHGEKEKRSRARLKFLIDNWGIEKFKEEVLAEKAKLPEDPRWTDYLNDLDSFTESPKKPGGEMPELTDPAIQHWAKTNVRAQRQQGYSTVTVVLPLGDITPDQLRSLSDIVQEFTNGTIRTSVEQNFVIRWVSNSDLPALHAALDAVNLAEPGASNILDIVACPGTDTCKLGISSSRGLAAELRNRLAAKSVHLDEAIQNLHIKISGCFNSCGQHHVADVGFYGASRTVGGYKIPHFQVVLGGEWEHNGGSYGLPIVAIPSKRAPDALDRITEFYMREKENGERFPKFVTRIGKGKIRQLLDDLVGDFPAHENEPSFYEDWGDPRQYSLGDIGKGECSGEVVSAYEFEMTACDRVVFGAQLALEEGDAQKAGEDALAAMIKAAKALVMIQYDDVTEEDPDEVVEEFKERYYDTELIFDPFAGSKFADYLFAAYEAKGRTFDNDSAHHLVEESQLFIEAVHSCYNRIRTAGINAA
ncbi:MAG: nitrite/sulfite reductase [Planctomycetales bacterium]|nr:nitrite/sulfite reductase [Planctomycetales bacterium]